VGADDRTSSSFFFISSATSERGKTMSTSDSTVKGKWDEIAGKAKQAFGDLTGDHSTANEGAAQEVKGHGEQAWGSVKEAVHDSTSTSHTGTYSDADTAADNTGHDVRNSVTSTAQNVKDHIRNAVDDFKK
jgi:uncharacterized protein YjbJ (UPF0337 family)